MTNKNIYTKVAEHHDELSQEHGAMHKFTQSKHEGMDDDHEDKAYFGKAAAHHEKCAKMHKDHADFMRKCAAAAPIDTHGDSGESVKVLETEDLIKNFVGGEDAAPAFTTTALTPAKGAPQFAAPLGQAIEELPGWTD